ncbi:hypothetical protein HYR54_00010 [Candidatus Acetothermia bacterium]|nr:hypothetical protein [Candidatus Acetothermia bacterium]
MHPHPLQKPLRMIGLFVLSLILVTTLSLAQTNSQTFQNVSVTNQLQIRSASPATASKPGVPSGTLSVLGSGWEAQANQALDVGITLQALVTDAKTYNLAFSTQRGTQVSNPVLTLGTDGSAIFGGNLTVNGLGTSRFTGDLAIGTSRDPAILSVTGAVNVSDAIKARSFQGSGAELTDFNASQIKGILNVTQLPSIPSNKILGTLDISQLPRNGYEGTYVKLAGDTMTGRLKLPILQVTGRSDFGEDVSVAGSLTVSQDFNVNGGLGVAGARPDATRNESLAVGGGARFLGFVDVTQQLRVRGTVTFDSNLIVGANHTVNGNFDLRGNGTVRGDFTVNGDVTAAAFHGVCKEDSDKSGTGCKDIAELFDATEPVQPGQLVALDLGAPGHVKLSSKPYETHLFGVVVAQPGIVLSSEGVLLGSDAARSASATRPAVALVGRVRVNATSANGKIEVGDALTSSSTRGVAMKASEAGRIIGFALEAFDGTTGSVLVLLNPSFYMPESVLKELRKIRN